MRFSLPAVTFLFLLPAAASAQTKIEVTGIACDHLVGYIEPPEVEYQPGVDAYGNAVAPADSGATAIRPPEKFTIPITDYLYSQLSAASGAQGVIQPQLLVGVVAYDHGRLTFNGQPLSGDPDGALGQLCRKALGR